MIDRRKYRRYLKIKRKWNERYSKDGTLSAMLKRHDIERAAALKIGGIKNTNHALNMLIRDFGLREDK